MQWAQLPTCIAHWHVYAIKVKSQLVCANTVSITYLEMRLRHCTEIDE